VAEHLLLPLGERVLARPHGRQRDPRVDHGLAADEPVDGVDEPLERLAGGHEPDARGQPRQVLREARAARGVDEEQHVRIGQGGAERFRATRRVRYPWYSAQSTGPQRTLNAKKCQIIDKCQSGGKLAHRNATRTARRARAKCNWHTGRALLMCHM
jgi:hypothetical protein